MLSLDDIIGLCDCTEEEIDAIAMHEHVPEAIASEMADYLVHSPDGVTRIRRIIIDDIETARDKGHDEQVKKLNDVLIHFVASHPEYKAKVSS